MTTRIYVVSNLDRDPIEHRLVRAATSAQAINHVTKRRYIAEVAKQQTLLDLRDAGIAVETAGVDPE